MRKYDSYKDSGIDWIGDIPSHWNVWRSKQAFNRNKEKALQEDPTILSLTSKGVMVRDISNNDGQIAESYFEYNSVEQGDLLLNPMDLVTNAFAFISKFDGVISPAYFNLKKKGNIESAYFQYYYQLQYWNLSFFHHGKGVSIEHRWTLNEETFKNFPIPLPPIKEQTEIAAYLDHKTAEIDELIADKKRLLELYEEEKTAIINQAVTKGINADAPMKDSGIEWLGEIPEHWDVKRLKYVAKMQGGFAFSSSDFVSNGIQLIKISNLYNNELRLDRQPTFLTDSFLESHSDWIISNGDILMSMTGTLGKRDYGFAILIEGIEGHLLLNQRVSKIHSVHKIEVALLIHCLRSEYFLNSIFCLPAGTKQGNFSNENILSQKIAFPPDVLEQQSIVSHIKTECALIDVKKVKTEKLIELLTEYRTALISEVVTGKIKVTE